jgi:hypothetical protein
VKTRRVRASHHFHPSSDPESLVTNFLPPVWFVAAAYEVFLAGVPNTVPGWNRRRRPELHVWANFDGPGEKEVGENATVVSFIEMHGSFGTKARSLLDFGGQCCK